MKKTVLLITALIGMTIQLNAQIPNSGFETWTTVGAYMEPQGFLTPNSLTAGPAYPVTRSTDHFPASMGSYSMRIESNIALLPNDGFGVVLQSNDGSMNNGPRPAFPVVGHPTSLTGYYKFTPQNGDSLRIQIVLYLNGTGVMAAEFLSTTAQANWTPFNMPIPTYTTADSASILMAAYNAAGPPPMYSPHGNSVLYVDNLNFDNLLTAGIPDLETASGISVYPNPSSEELTISFTEKPQEIRIFDLLGTEVKPAMVWSKQKSAGFDVSALEEGVYFVRITANDQTHYDHKITIVR